MLRSLFILLLFPVGLWAQDVVLEKGELKADGQVIATYEEIDQKTDRLPFEKNMIADNNPESTGKIFSDYVFSNAEGQQLVFVTAKVMASPYRGRLVYYYNIQFAGSESEVNIEYHPFTITNLANDLVKYKVLGNDTEDGIGRFVKSWNKKPSAMNEKHLQMSSKCNYNRSDYHVASMLDKSPVSIKDHNIYYKDTLIATYTISKALGTCAKPGTSKGDFYYFILYPDGKVMGEMEVTNLSSYLRVWPAPEKVPYKLYTAERTEVNLIKATTLSLLDRKQPQVASAKQ